MYVFQEVGLHTQHSFYLTLPVKKKQFRVMRRSLIALILLPCACASGVTSRELPPGKNYASTTLQAYTSQTTVLKTYYSYLLHDKVEHVKTFYI